MIGLALEGGGTKGSYQVGAYLALKKCGIKFNGITGTSIGSFNAAMIVAGKINELKLFWETEDLAKLLRFEKQIETNDLIDAVKNTLNPIKEIIKNKGIKIDLLQAKLDELLTDENVRNSKIDFGLVTFRLKDFKPLCLFKEDIPKGKINQYITASCYLPIFQLIKLDDDSYFLDGGFYDLSPSNMLAEKGYKKIYVISLKAIGFSRKKKGNAEIIKISPSRRLGIAINTSSLKMRENIKMGYFDTLKVLGKFDGYIYVFCKRPDWLYERSIRKVDAKTLNKVISHFKAKSNKEVILKAMEYYLKRNNEDYYQVYSPFQTLKRIKGSKLDNSIVGKFIQQLIIF